ncbi:MAG: hypothetical protein ABSG68_00700 [Thermoguttaceae bacterium]|jgi:hypothetical protein
MAVTVKKVVLWRVEVENKPGVLSGVLGPLAEAGVDLQVVMGYRYGDKGRAAIELLPVSGRKALAAARKVGLTASAIPTLLVAGDNRPGMGAALAEAIAEAGINLGFLVAQVVAGQFSAVIGLENEEDARKTTSLIKKVARK